MSAFGNLSGGGGSSRTAFRNLSGSVSGVKLSNETILKTAGSLKPPPPNTYERAVYDLKLSIETFKSARSCRSAIEEYGYLNQAIAVALIRANPYNSSGRIEMDRQGQVLDLYADRFPTKNPRSPFEAEEYRIRLVLAACGRGAKPTAYKDGRVVSK